MARIYTTPTNIHYQSDRKLQHICEGTSLPHTSCNWHALSNYTCMAKNWNQGKHFGGWDLGYPSMIQEHVNVVTVEGSGKGKYVCYTAMQLHRFGMTLHVLCMSCLPTALSWRRKLWAQAHQLDAIATIVTVILCPRLLSLHCLIHTVVYNLCILWILSISHI